MPKTLDEYIQKLPPEEQETIQRETALVLAEEATLRELRRALRGSQKALAEKLNVNQAAVSKLERRADMYVSTLRTYIESLGGRLEIIAHFPGKPPVRVIQFSQREK